MRLETDPASEPTKIHATKPAGSNIHGGTKTRANAGFEPSNVIPPKSAAITGGPRTNTGAGFNHPQSNHGLRRDTRCRRDHHWPPSLPPLCNIYK